ncbi:MAG TPA: alpha/beta hydrolase [Actinomycetes bacterium]
MTGADVLDYPPATPAEIDAAAVRCSRAARWASQLADGLRRDQVRLHGAWDGAAASSCRIELALAAGLAEAVCGPLQGAARALRAHSATVVEARARVDALRGEYDALLGEHRRRVAAVLGAGDVPGPLRRLAVEDLRASHAGDLGRVHALHRKVLARVRADAARTARLLVAAAREVVPPGARGAGPLDAQEAALAAGLPLLAASRRAAGVGAGPPPLGTPPMLVRTWWGWLTPDERDRLVARSPAAVGALDGLPAGVRSRANERRLDQAVATLRATGAVTAEEQRQLDNCLLVRTLLELARSRPDPLTREPVTAQLLVFDPAAFAAEGRVAIAVGDLDTADHVAFLVPGLGSDVRGGMARLTDNALRVTTESRRASATTTTATVAWMGYDAPSLDNVAFDAAAESGADLLAADVLAVQASRDVLPHLTVIGHSYGSTTAGTALRDHVTGTDDAVLVGSPGPGVETAEELQVPDGHVFVGASSRDPVSYLDRFGADPTHEDFGAVRFQAEDLTRNTFMLDVADHSKYFEPKTESLSSIVHVVVGDYAAVRPAPYRAESWFLPDGINNDPEADREPTVVP